MGVIFLAVTVVDVGHKETRAEKEQLKIRKKKFTESVKC